MNKDEKKKSQGEQGEHAPDEAAQAKPADYIRAARGYLKNGKGQTAFAVLQEAVVLYPEDPFILSYYGCLQAIVAKQYRKGVDACGKAIELARHASTTGEGTIHSVLYLNLGRAHLAARRRKDAVEAFQKGLKYDQRNVELLKEVRDLGIREKPPLSFLPRSNPINKYIGLLLNTSKKEKIKKRGK